MDRKRFGMLEAAVPANAARERAALRKIIAATDLSAGADVAVRRARMLAELHGASLVLTHVVKGSRSRRLADEQRRRALRLLQDWYGPTEPGRALVSAIRVETGAPAATIAEVAADEGAGLLVFGGPRNRLRSGLVGSTMEQAVRTSGLPALTVNSPPRRPYRRVVLGLNVSDASRHAVATARAFKLLEAPRVAVVHAFTMLGKARMVFAGVDAGDLDNEVARAAAEARARVREFLLTSGLAGFRRVIHVEEGAPQCVLDRAVVTLSAELVVIGTPALNNLRRLLCGSVAGDVVRRVRCDVLAVPSPADARRFWSKRPTNAEPPPAEPVWSVASRVRHAPAERPPLRLAWSARPRSHPDPLSSWPR